MILMRIGDLNGNSAVPDVSKIKGGKELEPLRYDSAGWFPIESANFGFRSESEANSKGGKNGGQGNQNQGGNQSSAPVPQSTGAPIRGGTPSTGSSNGNEAFSTMGIDKYVDMATIHLMQFAMQDRKKTKDPKKKDSKKAVRVVDIHFLDSMTKRDDSKSRFIFPYMMINLQNVIIKDWNITARGDDRPSESLTLWYDKAAMRYFATTTGEVWSEADMPRGWDQSQNTDWNPKTGEPGCDFFLKKLNTR